MARPTSTPTCTRGWRRRRAKRASRKLPTGSKLSPRPRNLTQDASPRRRARSNRYRANTTRGGPTRPPPAISTAAPRRAAVRARARIEKVRSQDFSRWPTESRRGRATAFPTIPQTKYWDRAGLEKEVERVFDICHTCRLCFNLCPSFPALFDATDRNDGDVRGLTAAEKERVIELCYGCKLCEIKCPYTPRDGHEFQLDFPRLILRAKAVNAKEDGVKLRERLLA